MSPDPAPTRTATPSADTPQQTFPVRRSCPYGPPSVYADLRDEAPLTRVRLPNGAEAWIVTGYAEVRALLTDPRVSAESVRPGFPILRAPDKAPAEDAPAAGPPLRISNRLDEMDPPGHTRFRKMLIPEFTHRRVKELAPKIEAVIDGILDEVLDLDPPVDLVRRFTLALPSRVICELLGVPYADHEFFQQRASLALGLATSETQGRRAFADVVRYLDELIAKKITGPSDDLIGRLYSAYGESDGLTHKELVGLAFQLLIAGHETTANMMALGVVTLLEHPERIPELLADPGALDLAVEELLRYHSIADIVPRRVAKEDIEVGGHTVRAGEGLVLLLGGANHDPAVFAEPGVFDPARGARHHVAFGYGMHQCVAQNLARAELSIGLRRLFHRIPGLRLDRPVDTLRFKYDSVMFGLHELPVTW